MYVTFASFIFHLINDQEGKVERLKFRKSYPHCHENNGKLQYEFQVSSIESVIEKNVYSHVIHCRDTFSLIT